MCVLDTLHLNTDTNINPMCFAFIQIYTYIQNINLFLFDRYAVAMVFLVVIGLPALVLQQLWTWRYPLNRLYAVDEEGEEGTSSVSVFQYIRSSIQRRVYNGK